jgi:hypothetical protein
MIDADDWTQTKGEGLTSDTSAQQEDKESRLGPDPEVISSNITPTVVRGLPTQAEADAVWDKPTE